MQDLFRQFIRDPLFHFILLGALLVGLISFFSDPEAEGPTANHIKVDRHEILTFLQYRLGVFSPEDAEKDFLALSDEDRKALIADYVRSEVLYKEAVALGLSGDDAVIRQRLVQRMEFALESTVAPSTPADDTTLSKWLYEHPERFMTEPTISFTHVFFRGSDVPAEAESLVRDNPSPDMVFGMGDNFPYQLAYAERSRSLITSQFGPEFANLIFSPDTPTGQWIGPLQSPHGSHFVYVSARQEARLPELTEVRILVTHDYAQHQRDLAVQQAIDALIDGYDIDYSDDLEAVP